MGDPIEEVLKELRDEMRASREHREKHAPANKPWYAREPFKDMLSHSVALCVGVVLAFVIHACTGAPITIEAEAPRIPAEIPSALATTTAFASSMPEPSVAAEAPSALMPVAASPSPIATSKAAKARQPVPPAPAAAAPAGTTP
jgi:hypothetical protein